VNFSITLFRPIDTWLRLVVWLALGMLIYFLYSRRHSHLTRHLLHEIQTPRSDEPA
jgi:APA family basic amino acid/polyamine antiporter